MTTTSVTPALAYPGYGQTNDFGSNWRVQFADADGIPLNMVSFEVIDFGAIAYKEIFQCVKTILATPLFSAALERLLGVDQTIVDLPIDQAALATVAVLDALYFWEPRVEVISVDFESDVISGHLICNLQLKIRNVIYGTEQPYDRNNIFDTPPRVEQHLPSMNVPVLIPGPPGPAGATGATGERGSKWIVDIVDPAVSAKPEVATAIPLDVFLNSVSGNVFQFDGTMFVRIGRFEEEK